MQPEYVVPTPTLPPGTPPTVAPELEVLLEPDRLVEELEVEDDGRDDDAEEDDERDDDAEEDDERDDDVEEDDGRDDDVEDEDDGAEAEDDAEDIDEDWDDDWEEVGDWDDNVTDVEDEVAHGSDNADDNVDDNVEDEASVDVDVGTNVVAKEEVVNGAPPTADCPLVAEPAVVDPGAPVPETAGAPAPPRADSAPWPLWPGPLPPLHAASGGVPNATTAIPSTTLLGLQLTMANLLLHRACARGAVACRAT